MAKLRIKGLALFVALSQLIAMAASSEDIDDNHLFYYLDKDNKLKMSDDLRAVNSNGQTFVEDGDTIRIYNDKNSISKQYGGRQAVFIENYEKLINEPYIWNRMQEVFPVEMFPSYDFAMKFYELLFRDLGKQGCGFVSFDNAIIEAYEGGENKESRKEEFEETFGFPMYRILPDNSIDFNYEYLVLDHFLFANKDKINDIAHMYDKTISAILLERYLHSSEYQNATAYTWNDIRDMSKNNLITPEEEIALIEAYQNADSKVEELKKLVDNSRDKKIFFGMSEQNAFSHFKEYLASYGISAKIDFNNINTKGPKFTDFKPGDIIVFESLSLYKLDEKTGKKYSKIIIEPVRDINGRIIQDKSHSVNVVDIENGKVVISNLGEKYYLDESDSVASIRIRVNIRLKGKTKN